MFYPSIQTKSECRNESKNRQTSRRRNGPGNQQDCQHHHNKQNDQEPANLPKTLFGLVHFSRSFFRISSNSCTFLRRYPLVDASTSSTNTPPLLYRLSRILIIKLVLREWLAFMVHSIKFVVSFCCPCLRLTHETMLNLGSEFPVFLPE